MEMFPYFFAIIALIFFSSIIIDLRVERIYKNVSTKGILPRLIDGCKIDFVLDNYNFNTAVLAFVRDIIANPDKYTIGIASCTITNNGGKSDNITVWAANEVNNRQFYDCRKDFMDENKNLSYFDQLLLDRICRDFIRYHDLKKKKFYETDYSLL